MTTLVDSTMHGIEAEIPEKARRRRFSAQYKAAILAEADRCSKSGELGALLRREGLYSSQLSGWRKQRREGALSGLAKKRGAKSKKTAEQRELERLRRENVQLRRKLTHAEKVIEVQKKLSEVLGVPLEEEEKGRDS